MSRQSSTLMFVMGLVFGVLTGVGLALLLAPQSGQTTRAQMKERGLRLKTRAQDSLAEAGHRVQEQAHLWQEKGKEMVDKGKHAAAEVMSHSKDSLVEAVHPHRPNGAV